MRIIDQDKQQLPPQSTYGIGQETPEMKNKTISGLVISIIDGNTFVMSVQNGSNGSTSEKHSEKVRIHGMETPSISTLSGILAKLELEKKIVGRKIECEVLQRDESDLIIAILPKQYLISQKASITRFPR